MDNKEKKEKRVENAPSKMSTDGTINTDPNGMWTGVVTDNALDDPVQDVDDL